MLIYICTRGRVNRQITLNSIPPVLYPRVRLVTVASEAPALRAAIDSKARVIALPDKQVPTLPDKRQWVQGYSYYEMGHRKVVMIDDDFVFLRRGPKKDPAAKTPYSMYNQTAEDTVRMFADIEAELDHFAVVTTAERSRSHTYSEDMLGLDYNTRVNGLIGYRTDVVATEGLRWDTYKTMEDFNMMLHLYRRGFESAVIVKWIWGQRGKSGADGGCSRYRTLDVHNATAAAIAKEHAPFVRLVQRTSDGEGIFKGTRTECVVAWKEALKSAPIRRQVTADEWSFAMTSHPPIPEPALLPCTNKEMP